MRVLLLRVICICLAGVIACPAAAVDVFGPIQMFTDPVLGKDSHGQYRASLWYGFNSSDDFAVGLYALAFGSGYGQADGHARVPVLSMAPLAGWGMLGVMDQQAKDADGFPRAGWVRGVQLAALPLLLLAPVNGTRITLGWSRAFIFAGHNLEVYAPHGGWSEALETGITLWGLEGAVFRRFSPVSGLRGPSGRLALTWRFAVEP